MTDVGTNIERSQSLHRATMQLFDAIIVLGTDPSDEDVAEAIRLAEDGINVLKEV